jgi:hypothetical protein
MYKKKDQMCFEPQYIFLKSAKDPFKKDNVQLKEFQTLGIFKMKICLLL